MRINLHEPRWDQSTYFNRVRHFFSTVNPLNIFKTPEQLERAKDIVTRYRRGENIPGLSEDDLWRAKSVYDSAFHPETGEKVFLLGRMSAQVPVNMFCVACMLNFNKSHLGIMFSHWVNQTFNAILNYCNRSGDASGSLEQLEVSYLMSTGGAIGVSSLARMLFKNMRHPMVSTYLPQFIGVSAAICISIPMMRLPELQQGDPVYDSKGSVVGHSVAAAKIGIGAVIFSRIMVAIPPMMFPPLIINPINKHFRLSPRAQLPLEVFVVGALLIFTTPMCCAIFPQKVAVKVSQLEEEIQEAA